MMPPNDSQQLDISTLDPLLSNPPKRVPMPSVVPTPAPMPASTPEAAPADTLDVTHLDPLFAQSVPESDTTEPTDGAEDGATSPKLLNIDPLTAAGAGGATGYLLNRLSPPAQTVLPDVNNARVNASVARGSADRLQSIVDAMRAEHASKIDGAKLEWDAAKGRLTSATQELLDAQEHARSLNAIPEPKPEISATGEPEPPKLSAGAERHAEKMSEIRAANKVQRGLEGVKEAEGLGSLPGYKRSSRLIIPDTIPDTAIYTDEQLAAKKRLADAEAAHKVAKTDVAKAQLNHEKLVKANPVPQNVESKVLTATENAAKTAQKASELEKLLPGPIYRTGVALSKPILGAVSGALAAPEMIEAYNQYQKGNYGQAALSGASGTGGLLMAMPNPYAKVAGAALMSPALAMQLYNYFHPSAPAATSNTITAGPNTGITMPVPVK